MLEAAKGCLGESGEKAVPLAKQGVGGAAVLSERCSGCPGDAGDDAVVAVEVADLEFGAEGRVVQLDVVARGEQVLDVAVLDAVAECVREQEPLRGEQALVGEGLELGDSGRGAVDENRGLEAGADEGDEGGDVGGAAGGQDAPAVIEGVCGPPL
ncbi:hypothetical protein ACH4C6_35160 [Streptomyces sp. NPDC017943]|uniref:hypothetical protein n=1 Tax=Streptomyces sp. NPDC017943 TaxID=3365019 RepID=UPI0037ACCBF0